MADPHTVVILGAVEGDLDEAVLRKLVEQEDDAILERTYGKSGKSHLKQKLTAYNHAARLSPWVVLMDLNHDAVCAPPLRAECLPDPAPTMCFRIAVRAIEAWLLADHEALAQFLGVAPALIPPSPETLDDPKHFMVEIARRSRRREIRYDMVPGPGSGRKVGPAYTSYLIEFVQTRWRPGIAARRSDSLRRCRERIRELINRQVESQT